MENICYVIMPYGGDDPVLQHKYEGVYRSIISAAAREAGFADAEIIREDHRGDAGMIVKNIVRHLTSSSIVIADLTGGNANVHYELGISHVFHKSSTVLICEKGTALPFDLQSLNVIPYSTDISAMATSVEKIRAAIIQRKEGLSAADNSVHEYVTALPAHLVEMLEMDESQSQAEIKKLTLENEALKRRLEASGIQVAADEHHQTIRSILTAAKARLKYSGAALMSTLKLYAEEKDLDSFVDYLINAMELGTPTRQDIDSIVELCDGLDNTPLLQDVLSAALILFPGDTELMTRLAKLYARRPATRKKAMEMVNSAIGLKRGTDGKYQSVDRSRLYHNDLARFLDTYLYMQAYDDLVEAASFLLENGAETERDMLTRNIFNALTKKGDLEEARKYLPVVEKVGGDYSWYLISLFYSKAGEVCLEYESIEKAFIASPDDMDYPRMLAAHILNEKVVRVSPEEIRKVSPAAARRAACALLYYILENRRTDRNEVSKIQSMMRRRINKMDAFFDQAIPFLTGKQEALPYEISDRYPLDFCLAQVVDE